MANADAHDAGVTGAAAVTLAVGLIVTNPILASLTALSCLAGGHLLSGDIDMGLNGQYTPRPVRRLQNLGQYWFWRPFSHIPHRHVLSHLPVLCTALKLLWASWPIALPIWFTGNAHLLALWYHPHGLQGEPLELTLLGLFLKHVFIGLAIADFTHWLQDGFPIHI